MQLQFEKTVISCLRPVVHQVQTLEQTQELQLPGGMGAAARILSAWGQPLLRSKQWQGTTLELTGGVQVWVAWEPEGGGGAQCLDAWIPVQLRWELPEGSPEGRVRMIPRLRFVDARLVADGKVMVRLGIAALAEGWVSWEAEAVCPESCPEDVELLQVSVPVRLPRESGEKVFSLEDTLTLPASVPQPEELLYRYMEPVVTDWKVLSDKLVFRGNGNLHICYRSSGGQVHSWDFEVPFQQHIPLENSYSADARVDVACVLTRLELALDMEGKLLLNAGLTGQYLVDDRQMLQIAEDAWSPCRELTVRSAELELPVLLDDRRETVCWQQQLPAAADAVPDALLLPDFPRLRREGDRVSLEQSGILQLMYYDPQGQLQSALHRWQGAVSFSADSSADLRAIPLPARCRMIPGGDCVTAEVEAPVQVISGGGQGLRMLSGMELGERRVPDPNRPSLVLRRAGKDRLWDIARENGSTVTAIREANGLAGEPEPERMLLIPVI